MSTFTKWPIRRCAAESSQRSVHSASLTESRTERSSFTADTASFMAVLVQRGEGAVTIRPNESAPEPSTHPGHDRRAGRRFSQRRSNAPPYARFQPVALARRKHFRARTGDALFVSAAAHGVYGGGHLRPDLDRRDLLRQGLPR